MGHGIIQQLPGKQDRSGTSRQHRQAVSDPLPQCIHHVQFPQEFSLHGTFPAGQDERIGRTVQILLLPDLKSLTPQRPEHGFMLGKIAL